MEDFVCGATNSLLGIVKGSSPDPSSALPANLLLAQLLGRKLSQAEAE